MLNRNAIATAQAQGWIEMKTKFMIVMFAVALSVAVQASASTWPDACGKDSIHFKVKTGKKHLEPAAPEAGKALLILSESVSGDFASDPTARFGVDGSWVGADRGASYFAVPVTPGEHHLCAVRQSGAKSDKVDVGEVTLNVAAGNVYYYDFKITRSPIGSPKLRGGGGLPGTPHDMTASEPDTADSVAFVALDENEGKHRMGVSPLSTFTAKP
jgi:hypothetical protein